MIETLAKSLTGMSSVDSETRVISATEIYRVGRALADHAVYPWWVDKELSTLLGGESAIATVGVAVTPERFTQIHEAWGLPRLADVPDDQDVREFELHLPGGPLLDVLTTNNAGGEGPLAKFLRKTGEGIQQVEFRCQDVGRATRILEETFGLRAVYTEARAGADGTRVNFFLVAAPGESKVLIELYESAQRLD
jgi:methylmalonyl-CoA/ethylmalonyl-CoA epimerase